MKNKLDRRKFLKGSAAIFGALAGERLFSLDSLPSAPERADIVVVKGDNPQKMVQEAIKLLGGMGFFVHRGDKVVILPNPQGGRPGVSTNAEMVAEVVRQCQEAGAAHTTVASIHGSGRWFATGIIEAVKKASGDIFYPRLKQDWVEVSLPKGKILKKAVIIRKAIENDVLINMPIVKQHDSSRITCNLKNLMGFNSNNTAFHQGTAYLHQCIVDLASFFSPKLSVVDANTILVENGPFGPGKVISPKKVIAGADMVAVDSFCCGLIGLKSNDVEHILGAHRVGLGKIDLTRLKIKEGQI